VRSLAGRALPRCLCGAGGSTGGTAPASAPASSFRLSPAVFIAAPDAYFQLPELKFGLIPVPAAASASRGRIGRPAHRWLALSGHRIKAAQALEWGLVDAVENL